MELEPTGWPALNLAQAAVRLPHYKEGTRLDELLFADPGSGEGGSSSDPPSRLDPPADSVQRTRSGKPPPGTREVSPEAAIALAETALALGAPGIKEGERDK